METVLFQYKDAPGHTDLRLQATEKGVTVYCFSLFDANSLETDICCSKPFSAEAFSRALHDLRAEGHCSLTQQDQMLAITKGPTGQHTLSFDGCGYNDHFVITGLSIDADAILDRLRKVVG